MTVPHVAIDGRVIADHFPGIGRYAFRLVEALAGLDGERRISLIVTRGQENRRFPLADLARLPNVRLVTVNAPVFGWRAQLVIPRMLATMQPDVFHATYWVTPYWPGVPTVLSLYDLVGRRAPVPIGGWRGLALEATVRLALRASRQVVTLSEASKRDLVETLGLPADAVTVTHLAADPPFRPFSPVEQASARERLRLPPRYVLYVGINKPHKNVETLILAFAELVKSEAPGDGPPEAKDQQPVLVLAGRWDPRYEGPRRLARDLLPEDRVRFLGPVAEDDLPALYASASAFAFPSRYEGFGLPPLEAMAAGTPVLASLASSLPEVVGEAGILLSPDDPMAWSQALRRVLDEPELASGLREAGLARAGRFSWRRTASETLSAYERAVEPG